jgi:hypothetical protein
MKLLLPISLILKLVTADREYLGLLPFDKCGSITQPQKGFWVGRGEGATDKLSFHSECEREGNNNGKCTIMCKNYASNLIMDRTKEGTWDRQMGDDTPQKKYLVKCKCETYLEDDGTVTTEDCRWKPRRYWKEEGYREEYDLGDAGEGEEPWVKPTRWPQGTNIVHLRKRRGLDEPRMRFYCEDEAPQHILDKLMIKPHDLNQANAVRQFEDNKGFESCGNMYDLFPTTGGIWHCKQNVTDPNTGKTFKQEVDPTNVPYEAVCAWGCNANGNWDSKEARFACVKPWIARPSGKFALKEKWRRFRGYGLRVYKQGMLECDNFDNDNNLRKKRSVD